MVGGMMINDDARQTCLSDRVQAREVLEGAREGDKIKKGGLKKAAS